MYITIDQAKKHLNIDAEFTADDVYIESLIEVAETVVERHIGYKLSSLAEANDGELPKPIGHAMLLFVGTMYANRESITFGSANELPLAYNYILQLFENYNVWC